MSKFDDYILRCKLKDERSKLQRIQEILQQPNAEFLILAQAANNDKETSKWSYEQTLVSREFEDQMRAYVKQRLHEIAKILGESEGN